MTVIEINFALHNTSYLWIRTCGKMLIRDPPALSPVPLP